MIEDKQVLFVWLAPEEYEHVGFVRSGCRGLA